MRRISAALGAGLLVAAAGPAAFDPASVAGRYHYRFQNGGIDGNTYWSDDVLEIVRVDRRRAYIRTETNFFNGHECSIAGIAHVEGHSLVYRDKEAGVDGRQCIITLTQSRTKILIHDNEGGCQNHCGSRGGWASTEFPRASRRAISYMARLKASDAYREALAEDEGRK